MSAILIENQKGELLFQKKDDLPHLPYPGAWAMVGGGMEPGESPTAALVREIEEELGLNEKQMAEITPGHWPPKLLFVDERYSPGRKQNVKVHVWLTKTTRSRAEEFQCLEGAGLKFFRIVRTAPATCEPFRKGTPSTKAAILKWVMR